MLMPLGKIPEKVREFYEDLRVATLLAKAKVKCIEFFDLKQAKQNEIDK